MLILVVNLTGPRINEKTPLSSWVQERLTEGEDLPERQCSGGNPASLQALVRASALLLPSAVTLHSSHWGAKPQPLQCADSHC